MNTPVSVDTAPFWARLSSFGEAPALLAAEGAVSYADLAARVTAMQGRLGPVRRLVAVEAKNDVDTVVAYLACLAGGHPVVLTADAGGLTPYDVDVVVSGGCVEELRDGSVHSLHPELALLLSTSGSTGSPKLVRLSHRNLAANAAAIASYLQIRPTDVAPTTLPLHYCYGLSVLNSHLSVGAAVLLTEASVTEASFWDRFQAAGCTTLAGVPYTFELLDRVGFADLDLPTLRYVTQAGGKMSAADVRRYAELGLQRGFDLYVMYGATEATARMAYLPPDLALTHPEAIGFAVPGGVLRIDDGELVYRGDNVMLGYATSPEDLAKGREVTELRTGDLATCTPDGVFEVTGRKARIAKVFGLRIDLARVEAVLAEAGIHVHCADGRDQVVVGVDVSARPAPADLAERAAVAAGLPVAAVEVVPLTVVPRLPTGKPDYRAIVAAGRADVAPRPDADVAALFAEVLRRPVSPEDTFVSLGGDSLSYVEMSVRLERALGLLPSNWHTTPVRELAAVAPRKRRTWVRTVETNVLLRAIAIVLVVGSHADLFDLMGGAHVLLAVVGFNFGRFLLTRSPRVARVRAIATSGLRIAVPAMVWLAVLAPFASSVEWQNVLLLNGVLGPDGWSETWRYWFIEAIVYLFVWMAALLAVPAFDRAERRWPFWLPVFLTGVALLTRYDVVRFSEELELYRAHVILWLFTLGWATAKASSHWHRLVVSALAVATVPGAFVQVERSWIVTVGLLLLVWLPSVRLPALLAGPVGLLAGASLFIYLTHWQLYPEIEAAGHSLLATVVSLVVGALAWCAVGRLGEIRDNRGWLNLRRYATRDTWTQPAARPRGHDQPAHVAA